MNYELLHFLQQPQNLGPGNIPNIHQHIMQYAQQQCMDPIMLTENSVNNYLNQDPNNFVINLNEAGQGPPEIITYLALI